LLPQFSFFPSSHGLHLIASHRGWTHLNHTEIFDLSIVHLDVAYNDVRQIARNQFVHHKLLKTFILSGNKRLEIAPNQSLLNADNLETFECENCGIRAVDAQTLQGNAMTKIYNKLNSTFST
jgi:hypothetical protein